MKYLHQDSESHQVDSSLGSSDRGWRSKFKWIFFFFEIAFLYGVMTEGIMVEKCFKDEF